VFNDERTYGIIGAAMATHAKLGAGLMEVAYHRGLSIEFAKRAIPYSSEVPVPIWYDGHLIGTFKADFLCHESVLVELKVAPAITRAHISQLSHYLRSSGIATGLLLNFGTDSLQFKRVVPPGLPAGAR